MSASPCVDIYEDVIGTHTRFPSDTKELDNVCTQGCPICRYPTAFFCYLIPVIGHLHLHYPVTWYKIKPCWDASCTLGLPKQSNSYQSPSWSAFVLEVPPYKFCTMWWYRAKGLAIRHSHDTCAFVNGFLLKDLNVSHSFYLWRALRWKPRFNETLYIDIRTICLKTIIT